MCIYLKQTCQFLFQTQQNLSSLLELTSNVEHYVETLGLVLLLLLHTTLWHLFTVPICTPWSACIQGFRMGFRDNSLEDDFLHYKNPRSIVSHLCFGSFLCACAWTWMPINESIRLSWSWQRSHLLNTAGKEIHLFLLISSVFCCHIANFFLHSCFYIIIVCTNETLSERNLCCSFTKLFC